MLCGRLLIPGFREHVIDLPLGGTVLGYALTSCLGQQVLVRYFDHLAFRAERLLKLRIPLKVAIVRSWDICKNTLRVIARVGLSA